MAPVIVILQKLLCNYFKQKKQKTKNCKDTQSFFLLPKPFLSDL